MIATVMVLMNDSTKLIKSEMTEDRHYTVGDKLSCDDKKYSVSSVITRNHLDYSSIIQYITLIPDNDE